MKKALITGISGQDGFYLSKLLIDEGYFVAGFDLEKTIDQSRKLLDKEVKLYPGSILDKDSLTRVVLDVKPDEIYNLASQSSTGVSFREPELTFQINAHGLHNLLEIIRNKVPETRLFEAASADIFGNIAGVKNEESKINPESPYAVSKAAAYFLVKSYRESYKLFLVNGILFPHESKMRGELFVTRKITKAAAAIKLGKQEKLFLGDLNIARDWGYAGDYVVAMHKALQYSKPEDFIISTAKALYITDVLNAAFSYFKLDWEKYVEKDPSLVRPVEIKLLLGDNTKIKKLLNWEPKKPFREVIEEMVEHDFNLLKESL